MNQGAHRRRAFHRVREPYVQRQLPRFSHRSTEDQQRNAGGGSHAKTNRLRRQQRERRVLHASRAVVVEKQRARLPVKPHHAQQQTEVTDPGGNERLLGRGRRGGPFIPKTNQQVRREPHNLPTHKQQQEAIGDQQPEHRPRKEGEKAEKTG